MSMSALGLSSPIRKYDPSASRVHSNFINKTKISKIATGGSMLSFGNMLTGSQRIGVLRTTRDPVTYSSDIHRVGGRPLTAQCGPHLLLLSTHTPNSCHAINHRII